jgi:hypothetical protein
MSGSDQTLLDDLFYFFRKANPARFNDCDTLWNYSAR